MRQIDLRNQKTIFNITTLIIYCFIFKLTTFVYFQNEQTHKCQELLQARTEFRETKDLLAEKDNEILALTTLSTSKDEEIAQLQEEIQQLTSSNKTYDSMESLENNYKETERLRAEIKELREELSDMSISDYSGIEPGRVKRSNLNLNINEDDNINKCKETFIEEVDEVRKELDRRTKQFETEKRTWAQEKEKVLKYQRQLQMNYVQMYQRSRAMEAEIENLTVEMELDKTGMKSKLGLSQTIEL